MPLNTGVFFVEKIFGCEINLFKSFLILKLFSPSSWSDFQGGSGGG
jgi:hypothetical protein